MNLSTSFLLWIPKIKGPEYVTKLQEIYCGNVEYEGSDNWGDYLYLVFENTLSATLLNQLRNHEQYVKELDPTESTVMFIFKLTDEQKMGVVYPFLEGKYSKIDRSYVKDNFTQFTGVGTLSTNWRILHKDPGLKALWEEQIGVTFTDDMEVWSKPLKKNEVLGFVEEEKLESVPLI